MGAIWLEKCDFKKGQVVYVKKIDCAGRKSVNEYVVKSVGRKNITVWSGSKYSEIKFAVRDLPYCKDLTGNNSYIIYLSQESIRKDEERIQNIMKIRTFFSRYLYKLSNMPDEDIDIICGVIKKYS